MDTLATATSWAEGQYKRACAYRGTWRPAVVSAVYAYKFRLADGTPLVYVGYAAQLLKTWTLHAVQLAEGTHENQFIQLTYERATSRAFEVVASNPENWAAEKNAALVRVCASYPRRAILNAMLPQGSKCLKWTDATGAAFEQWIDSRSKVVPNEG